MKLKISKTMLNLTLIGAMLLCLMFGVFATIYNLEVDISGNKEDKLTKYANYTNQTREQALENVLLDNAGQIWDIIVDQEFKELVEVIYDDNQMREDFIPVMKDFIEGYN